MSDIEIGDDPPMTRITVIGLFYSREFLVTLFLLTVGYGFLVLGSVSHDAFLDLMKWLGASFNIALGLSSIG